MKTYSQQTGVEDVRELDVGMDFRRPEYRREVFMRFYEFHLKYKAHAGAIYYAFPYLFDYIDADKEQRLWIIYLNGCTQNIITTYFLFREFPDVHNINLSKLATFMDDNWKKLQWDMDRRYAKAKTVEMVENYKHLVRGGQQDYFAKYTGSSCLYRNFRMLWEEVFSNYKYYGRLSTFSYLEYLRIGGVDIDCDELFIGDISGSKSHRNGICKVMGRDDYDWTNDNEVKYTDDNLIQIETWGAELLEEAHQRIDHPDVSYFTLETTLCCYKGWHRVNRRYPNVYNDMFAERIRWSENRTGDKDLEMFWRMRKEFLPKHLRLEDNPKDVGLKPTKQNHYRHTGEVIMMHKDWDCFQNSYNDFTENT